MTFTIKHGIYEDVSLTMRVACRLVMTPNYAAHYLARYRTAHIFVLIPVWVNEEMWLSGVQLI